MPQDAARFGRRSFLAGAAAGASLLAPLPRSLLGRLEARADHVRPKRFVFLVKSNGLWAENVQPRGLGARLPFRVAYDRDGRLEGGNHGKARKLPTPGADLALGSDVELSPVMEPLHAFRHRISILQGVASGFPVYHDGCYQALGAFVARRRDTADAAGPTVDAVLARAFTAPVPHVRLGHDPKAASGVSYITTSAAAKDRPLPFYTKPVRAYRDLFGVVGGGAAKTEYDTQTEVLDFHVREAERLREKIGAPERKQLDGYLDAFESLRASRRRIEAMRDALVRFAPPSPGEVEAQATTRITASHFDTAAAALASGLTNVVTIALDTLGSTSYPSLKVGGLHGSVGHGQGGDVAGKRQRICRFHFEQAARLAAALERIPEGDGTMLDNTLIVYTSNNGETHHSSGVNWPIVLLGDLGGRLKRGRYFAPGNDVEDRTGASHVRLGDVWATLLASAGQPHEGFGQPKSGTPHRPIEALLA